MCAQPMIQLDGCYFIQSLVWNYYNYQVIAAPSGVALPDGGQSRGLLSFNGFDELLAMR